MSFGCRGWSPELDILLDRRIYRSQTVDAVLQDRAVVLGPETLSQFRTAPGPEAFRLNELPARRPLLALVAADLISPAGPLQTLERIAAFTHDMENRFPSPEHPASAGYYVTPDDFWWGGTEEMVITKGSDWCAEVARVCCALAQLSGMPSRIVYAHSRNDGHVLTECFALGRWVLVDPLAPLVYQRRDGSWLSAADMAAATPQAREKYTGGHPGAYVDAKFFECMAVSEYRLIEAASYDYGISHINDFYRELLRPIWNAGLGDVERR
jgi:hypothetical protein